MERAGPKLASVDYRRVGAGKDGSAAIVRALQRLVLNRKLKLPDSLALVTAVSKIGDTARRQRQPCPEQSGQREGRIDLLSRGCHCCRALAEPEFDKAPSRGASTSDWPVELAIPRAATGPPTLWRSGAAGLPWSGITGPANAGTCGRTTAMRQTISTPIDRIRPPTPTYAPCQGLQMLVSGLSYCQVSGPRRKHRTFRGRGAEWRELVASNGAGNVV